MRVRAHVRVCARGRRRVRMCVRVGMCMRVYNNCLLGGYIKLQFFGRLYLFCFITLSLQQ